MRPCNKIPCKVKSVRYNVSLSSCAVAFLGHFNPFETVFDLININDGFYGSMPCHRQWNYNKNTPFVDKLVSILQKSTCVTVLRDPVDRMISHYYEFTVHNNPNLTAAGYMNTYGAEKLFWATGSNIQSRQLGSFFENATSEIELLYNAKIVIDNCIVGVTEYFSDFLRLVSDAVDFDLPNEHTRDHSSMYSQLREKQIIYNQTVQFFNSDYIIYEYAKKVFLERNNTIVD